MCLIIFTPNVKTARIRKVVLERAFLRHSDGAGLAYVKGGEIKVSKGYHTFERFFEAYQKARSDLNGVGALLIHFRRKTCGPVNYTNTQPLAIYRHRLVMAHNGVFHNLSETGSDISDSVRLSHIIRKMGWNFPFCKGQLEMLDVLCGDNSKLVFMDNKDHHLIVNEDLGKWRRGCWYSDAGDLHDMPSRRYGPAYGPPDDKPRTKTKVTPPKSLSFRAKPGKPISEMTPMEKLVYDKQMDGWRAFMRGDQPFPPTGVFPGGNFKKHSVIDNDHLPTLTHPKVAPFDPDMMNDDDWRRMPT